MSLDHRDGITIRCFFQLNNPQLTLLKHKLNKRDFVFHDIRRWPVISLVTLIHGRSYFISFNIVLDYWKVRSFQETQVKLNGLLEKPDIMYPLWNSKMESHEPNCRIIPKT